MIRDESRHDQLIGAQAETAGEQLQPRALLRLHRADYRQLMLLANRRWQHGKRSNQAVNILAVVDATRIHDEGAMQAKLRAQGQLFIH